MDFEIVDFNEIDSEVSVSPKTFILIDGSYFLFARYHAMLIWWKNAFPEQILEDPFQNELFVDKFRKTFQDQLKIMPKKLGLKKREPYTLMVAKDCKRQEIWRMNILPEYKGTRLNGPENGFMGGPFFKMAYEDDLFIKGGAQKILKHPKLEADDCIALYTKKILSENSQCNIYIITSDKDYLQLAEPRVHLYNLGYKKLTDQKSCSGDPLCDLFCKIISGDISDNIPAIFPKCGPKTALKYYNDRALFEQKLAESENAQKLYKINKSIIDFNEIPEDLINQFYYSL